MNFKVKKEFTARIENRLVAIPVGTIFKYDDYYGNRWVYELEVNINKHKYYVDESFINNSVEYFESIEEKMTWDKLKNMFLYSPIDIMATIQKHCILKDELIAVGGSDFAKFIPYYFLNAKDGKFYETYVKQIKWFVNLANIR